MSFVFIDIDGTLVGDDSMVPKFKTSSGETDHGDVENDPVAREKMECSPHPFIAGFAIWRG
ncbi:hypothetical protein [Paenibacillus peoriae]|uniref:hypothetical protein n=1 Tax=Paenibacillus peoriae TaxID=59893 RepID=UPI002117075E|nr:hypothetical protein [Paenibacillus peoriae]